MRWLPTAAIWLAFAAVAHADDAPLVVGGADAPPGKWPDVVAVIADGGTCSGTLIAPDLVLTAGHCAALQPSEIVANTVDYASGQGISVAVKSVTAYPDWRDSYDLALIVLATPITTIAPRTVAASCTYDAFDTDTMVHIVGFGLTTDDGDGTNTVLHEAMAPVTDPTCDGDEGCRAQIAPGGEFAAGGDGVDSCFGDSGGPVYLSTPRGDILIGAVSRGVSGAATPCGDGGIYVRPDHVVAWVEQISGEQLAVDSCPPPTLIGSGSGGASPQVTGGCAASGGGNDGWVIAMIVGGAMVTCGRGRGVR